MAIRLKKSWLWDEEDTKMSTGLISELMAPEYHTYYRKKVLKHKWKAGVEL